MSRIFLTAMITTSLILVIYACSPSTSPESEESSDSQKEIIEKLEQLKDRNLSMDSLRMDKTPEFPALVMGWISEVSGFRAQDSLSILSECFSDKVQHDYSIIELETSIDSKDSIFVEYSRELLSNCLMEYPAWSTREVEIATH